MHVDASMGILVIIVRSTSTSAPRYLAFMMAAPVPVASIVSLACVPLAGLATHVLKTLTIANLHHVQTEIVLMVWTDIAANALMAGPATYVTWR